MNFDLDDPLGDLLSDGSDDSFFESGKKKTASTPKAKDSATSNKPATASKMENLFGISTEESKPPLKSQQPNQSSAIGTSSGPNSLTTQQPSIKSVSQPQKPVKAFPSPAISTKATTPKKEITFEDDDDLSLDLGFDPKKPKSGKKISILDDLLGVSEPKKSVITPNKPKTPPSKNQPPPGTPSSVRLSRQSTFEKPDNIVHETTTYTASSAGRSRPLSKRESSNSLNDPLGLFPSTSAIELPLKTDSKSSKKSNPTADWLGIGDDSQGHNKEPVMITQQSSHQVPNFIQQSIISEPSQPVQQTTVATITPSYPIQNLAETFKPNISETAQILNVTTKETETALTALKQQESQLMIAAQMKNQEIALMEMHKRQEELLRKQETNFNELLQKQLHRQSALEVDIKRQQDRINSHIQILMSQPISEINNRRNTEDENEDDQNDNPTEIYKERQKKSKKEMDENRMNEIVLRSEIKILELEKLRLEDLVHNIKTNHEQELDLLEKSHKKQTSLMEENISKLEQRLRNENESLQVFYDKKLSTIDTEKQDLINSYEIKLKSIEERYDLLLEKIKNQHEDDVENIKNDHRNMIQNIRESKLLEFSLVQENTSYLQTLKSASNYMETVSENMQSVKDELRDRIESIYEERNMQLTIKEKNLEVQQKQMIKHKESTENERIRLLDLVKSLEIKLNTLTQTTSEEQWNLRQKEVSLEAERTSLERERLFSREQLIRDEKRIEELKTYQIEEHRRLMKQIDDERIALHTDKAKFEMMSRLNRPMDTSVPCRTEIDSAIKIAEDAARQCDVERERYIDLQRQVETKKREIIDKERNIRAKDIELESAITAAESKQANSEAAIKTTKMVEAQLFDKISMLQQNYRDLTNREQNLSQTKLEMTKERLELQSIRNKLYQSRCSLCKIGERSQELADILTKNNNDNEFLPSQIHGKPNDDLIMNVAEQANKAKTFDIPNLDMDSKQYEKYLDMEVTNALNKMKEDSMNNLEMNLDSIPDLAHTSNNLLDHELLMVKLDAMRAYNYL